MTEKVIFYDKDGNRVDIFRQLVYKAECGEYVNYFNGKGWNKK